MVSDCWAVPALISLHGIRDNAMIVMLRINAMNFMLSKINIMTIRDRFKIMISSLFRTPLRTWLQKKWQFPATACVVRPFISTCFSLFLLIIKMILK